MKFLIVDDDELSRIMLAEILKDLGQCDVACDGYEAITAFMKSRLDGSPYDLICLDIIMPEIDGFQVLKQIRVLEAKEGISYPDSVRVILVSSMSDLEHLMMSLDSRCEAFMLKPFSREQLLAQLPLLGITI